MSTHRSTQSVSSKDLAKQSLASPDARRLSQKAVMDDSSPPALLHGKTEHAAPPKTLLPTV